ncbi:arsenic transporter [Microbacterium sp. cx-55]|uniref:SLC13 family permease n=1 Tax=Microbacterium sp. cx-55 TaxID=2875948 RepID=UPI001CC0DD12|nr:SLC13 family permease [Microbacterium sp. cx-55]MBZ4486354.1 arsenic transporter [Microbacterium sp. cx-55]UGB33807.1 arsenic transporter [Microbacterium sp. cx-55]
MKLAIVGCCLVAVAVIALLVGAMPWSEVATIADRVWPILAFVVAVTVVAELAARAGVFDVVAGLLARLARGRTMVLWLFVVLLAVLATAFLSLDTTAVLLTPVVVAVARANGLPPLPFAFATVWLANTASLVLPVSNLTNLLASERLTDAGTAGFVSIMAAPAAVAILVTVVILWLRYRTRLRGTFDPAPLPRIADRPLFTVAAVVVGVMMPLLVSGVEPWIPASGAAVVLLVVFVWRSPRTIRVTLVPWSLLVFASGLFLVAGVAESSGLLDVVAGWLGSGDDLFSLWGVAGAGAIGANLVNNLPAYLALEPATSGAPERLAALLVGVNAGPLITPWASLATLLWHQRLSADGIEVPWRRFILWGALATPLVVLLAVVPLAR